MQIFGGIYSKGPLFFMNCPCDAWQAASGLKYTFKQQDLRDLILTD